MQTQPKWDIGHPPPGSGNTQKGRQKNSRFGGWPANVLTEWEELRILQPSLHHLPEISKYLLAARGGKDIFFSGGDTSKVPMLCK